MLWSNSGELLGLEDVNVSSSESFSYFNREIKKADVVIYKARDRDMRGCFTLQDVT